MNGFGLWFIAASVLAAGILLASFIVSGIAVGQERNVNNSELQLIELAEQRDAVAEVFEDVLSNEDFTQLMEAAVPEDLAFLKNNPQVSEFLLGRADRLVALNATLFASRNQLITQAKSVCNMTQNPFVPQFPLFQADCDLNIDYAGLGYDSE